MRPGYQLGRPLSQNLIALGMAPELETFFIDSEWTSEIRTDREYIRWVQTSLNKIMGLRLAVDGIKGPQTSSAVRSFQQRSGLVVDGIVGPKTEAALIAAGADRPPGSVPGPSGGPPTPGTTVDGLTPVVGIERTSTAFRQTVIEIARRLGTDPNFLMAIMSFETGGTFSPSILNAAGSGAVGLIQFLPSTARNLGTTAEALARMTAEEQLDFVERYFTPFAGRLRTLEDAYMAVLFPVAVGKGSSFVLFSSPSRAYELNKGLDSNKDGHVTVAEAAAMVRARFRGTPPGTAPPPTGTVVNRSSREYVRWVQESLNKIMGLRLVVDGIKGVQTTSAIRSFQTRAGLVVDGIVGPKTEAALIGAGASRPPTTSSPTPSPTPGTSTCTTAYPNTVVQLPPNGQGFYSSVTSSRRFGTQQTIQAWLTIAANWSTAHPSGPRIGIGDISLRCGGRMSPHVSHDKGKDADIRLIRNDGKEQGTVYTSSTYSRSLTQELVNLIRANPVARVQYVFFNDPSVTGVKPWPGHDNHLHVRFY